jgi:Tfp pilus assembly protein PilV
MKIRSSDAFSMVEVIVAAVLFLVAASGILGTMIQTRKPSMESDQKTRAALYAQRVSEWLRSDLAANTWDTNVWMEGQHSFPAAGGFNGTYTVINTADGGKQVVIDVTY